MPGTPLANLRDIVKADLSMNLNQSCRAVQTLSPRSAGLAMRMLKKLSHLPFDWYWPLAQALTQRAKDCEPLTSTDFMAITNLNEPTLGAGAGLAGLFDDADRARAKSFIAEVCQSVAQARSRAT